MLNSSLRRTKGHLGKELPKCDFFRVEEVEEVGSFVIHQKPKGNSGH